MGSHTVSAILDMRVFKVWLQDFDQRSKKYPNNSLDMKKLQFFVKFMANIEVANTFETDTLNSRIKFVISDPKNPLVFRVNPLVFFFIGV